MKKRKKTDYVQFKIRLRESLRKQLEVAAHAKDVSLNSEMVSRLEESFTRAELGNMQDRFERRIQQLEELIKNTDGKRTKEVLQSFQRHWQWLQQHRALDAPFLEELERQTAVALTREQPVSDQEPENDRRYHPRENPNATNEQRRANWLDTARGYRRGAERYEARGEHDKAALLQEFADELVRNAGRAPQQQRSLSDIAQAIAEGKLSKIEGGKS